MNTSGNNYSHNEMAKIYRLKRLFEYFEGDAVFREAVKNNNLAAKDIEKLQRIGIDFKPREITFFSEIPGISRIYNLETNKCSSEEMRIAASYPLLSLWLDYKGHLYNDNRSNGEEEGLPKNFAAWRKRRLAAIKSELGITDASLFIPTVALELSVGCSMGCWFCAFSVNELTKVLDYRHHKEFFQKIIEGSLNFLGREQPSATLLYHGTEPYDNPDYLEFVKDYEKISGEKPFTSTSVVHDERWLKKLIDYYGDEKEGKLRINLLSVKNMLRLFMLYTPEELKNVELFMQMKDSIAEKALSGRNYKEHQDIRNMQEGQDPRDIKVPQGSIACIAGFAINLVEHTIQLVSPCYAGKKWPYGYRVFETRFFKNETDFLEVIKGMIEDKMPQVPPDGQKLAFRDDLIFRPNDNGFTLISPNQIHYFKLHENCRDLGVFIASGELTFSQVYNLLVKGKGANPLIVTNTIQKLYDDGFIDER